MCLAEWYDQARRSSERRTRWVPHRRQRHRQTGLSYLEVQVSLVLFATALSGLAPLSVIQSRQMRAIETHLRPATTHYLHRPTSLWARKLGAAAAISVEAPPSEVEPVRIVDDGDLQYSQKNRGYNDWYYWNWRSAFNGDIRFNRCDGQGDKVTWTFNQVRPGRYDVLVTYRPFRFLNPQAEYQIYEGKKRLTKTRIDQRREPDGPSVEGVTWQSLGIVEIRQDQLEVRLSDKGSGYIEIDAVRIQPVKIDLELVSVSAPLEGTTAEAVVSVRVPGP